MFKHRLIFWLHEIIGSLGDLPLFFIFLVGLTQNVHLNPLSILFWSGVVHVIAGLVFKIPLSYQPMKAMGIFAITTGVTQGEYLMAGFVLGILIVLLNSLHLFQKIYDFFPMSVIRGIQVGLGILLFKKSIELMAVGGAWSPFLNLVPHMNISFSFLEFPGIHMTWTSAVLTMIVIQFPLTVANSIVSPALLVRDYFPRHEISASKIAWSVGWMNLLLCPLGAMPACHGAGGLSAQYRFGARTGVSIIFLGAIKILSALCFGAFFLDVASHFPKILMGIFFLFPAFDLCFRIRKIKNVSEITIAIVTAALYVFWNITIAFILGWVFYKVLSQWFKMRLKES